MTKNKNLIGFVIIAIIVVLAVVFSVSGDKASRENGYSIVHLSNGEVYVGKLSTPAWELKDAYLFESIQDPIEQGRTNFQLTPVKSFLGAPEVMHLVKENVVFYGPLRDDSRVAENLVQQENSYK